MLVSAKYANFNTGFTLTPEGGLDQQAGRDFTTAQSFGSTSQSLNLRPQQVVNVDLNSFWQGGGAAHDVKYGVGFRRADALSATVWPGNGVLAIENSPADLRAQVFRQGMGTNRAQYLDFYAGDTISKGRLTVDAGIRYDRQSGQALASVTQANAAFADLVPGLSFGGYDAPFTWKNVSPRAGVSYALDESRQTVARASGVRAVKYLRPAGGFTPANPTAVLSANQVDPNLTAPITHSIVASFDKELMPNLAVQVSYSYTRTSNLFGNSTNNLTPRIGVTGADYAAGPALTGALPDGTAYNIPTFRPDPAKVTSGGNGFLLTNVPGYYTDYSGLEFGLVKRLSNRWMARAGFSYNNAREHFSSTDGLYDANGNARARCCRRSL